MFEDINVVKIITLGLQNANLYNAGNISQKQFKKYESIIKKIEIDFETMKLSLEKIEIELKEAQRFDFL